MFELGLTLGKFAPFHQGHQYLIEQALTQVKTLVILVYPCEELPDIGVAERVNWIQTLYPQTKVIIAHNGPMTSGYSDEIIEQQNRYLKQRLAAYQFDVFFSSEPYGKHVSEALECKDVRIDQARLAVPISATKIRNEPAKYQHYLHPLVKFSMLQKIVLLGAPSTGKSTLAAHLAARLGTVCVPEYGREYWLEHQVERRLTAKQLLHIATVQEQWEIDYAANAKDYLICDTNAFTTWHFALHYHDDALPELADMAERCWQRYDLVVLCDDDIPYDDTWERSGDANRAEFQQFNREYLAKHKIPHIVVSGPVEQRAAKVIAQLEKMRAKV